MKQRQRRFFPFSYKLLVSYLLLVIIPVMAIGFYSYTSLVESEMDRTKNNLQVTLQQINDNIKYKLQDIERSSFQLHSDSVLSKYVTNYHTEWERFQILKQYILPKLESALNLPNSTVLLSLYTQNESINEIYYTGSGDPLKTGRRFQIYHMNRIKDAAWFRDLDLEYDQIEWKPVGNDEEFGNISLLSPLIDFDTLSSVGLIRITVKLSDLFETVNFNKLGGESHLLVVDRQGHPIYYSSQNSEMVSDLLKQQDRYLTISKDITALRDQLVALIPLSSLEKSANRVRNLTVWICFISFVVLSLISYLISKYFSKRITKLIYSLHAFREGNFRKRIRFRSKDEFSLIADAFNDMATTIEGLVEEVYINKLQKKEDELRILQAQINPHFLYNSLSSISRLAKLGEADKLHQMVRGLAKFYRLTLNKGEMIISIANELEQIRAYVDIQKIKYADQVQVHYDIEPAILGYDTVKLIFQPFVENVLEHAWYTDRISINLVGYAENDSIVFKIIDNGIGMKQETLEQIFNPNGSSIGYGIRNVDERIKLQFGRPYGVRLFSGIGIGTTVQIVIPQYTWVKSNG